MINTYFVERGAFNSRALPSPLTPEGRKQVKQKGDCLKDKIKGTPRIISSGILRYKESAEIIAKIFDTDFEEKDLLLKSFDKEKRYKKLFNLIGSKEWYKDVIVIVPPDLIKNLQLAEGEDTGLKFEIVTLKRASAV